MEAVGPVNYAGCLRCADRRRLDYGRQDGWQSWDPNSMNDVESASGESVSGESAFEKSAFEKSALEESAFGVASENIPFGEAAFGGITFVAKMVLEAFVVAIEVTEAYETLWQTSREPPGLLFSAVLLPSSLAELLRQVARPS